MSDNESIHRELWTVVLAFVGLFIAITLFRQSYWFLLPPALAYLGWHLYNISKLLHWLSNTSKPLPDDIPGVWGEMFYRLELHQRKNNARKKQVKRLLKNFNSSAQALPDATVVLNEYFEIQWVNQAAIDLLNLRKTDGGQPIGNFIRSPSFHSYLGKGDFDESVTLTSPVHAEDRILISIVPYGQGQYLLLGRDITEQQRIDQIRQDFIANASHELRTPLTVLQGSIEQLENLKLTDKKANTAIAWMRNQSERMKSMLDDLLSLARLERRATDIGHQQLIAAPMMLNNLLAEAENLSAQNGGHQINHDIDTSIAVRGNSNALHAAFSNLIFNAIRYTPAGGSVDIIWARGPGGAYFEVTDTGPGIPTPSIPRLTERFYRVDHGRTRESGGTGLGLSIVKHALEHFNSMLEIRSRLGKGSSFSFSIAEQFIEQTQTKENAAQAQ